MKKTLDFWEQGSIYPKEVVQYVKDSFLKQSKQDKGYYQTQFYIKRSFKNTHFLNFLEFISFGLVLKHTFFIINYHS